MKGKTHLPQVPLRTAINAAIIRGESLLLVRKHDTWILPGGKPEPGESDLECLCREVSEELSGTRLCNIKYYRHFDGQTPHRGDVLRAKVYFARIDGKLYSVAEGDSISDVNWVSDFSEYNLSDITAKIIDSLVNEGYLRNRFSEGSELQ